MIGIPITINVRSTNITSRRTVLLPELDDLTVDEITNRFLSSYINNMKHLISLVDGKSIDIWSSNI